MYVRRQVRDEDATCSFSRDPASTFTPRARSQDSQFFTGKTVRPSGRAGPRHIRELSKGYPEAASTDYDVSLRRSSRVTPKDAKEPSALSSDEPRYHLSLSLSFSVLGTPSPSRHGMSERNPNPIPRGRLLGRMTASSLNGRFSNGTTLHYCRIFDRVCPQQRAFLKSISRFLLPRSPPAAPLPLPRRKCRSERTRAGWLVNPRIIQIGQRFSRFLRHRTTRGRREGGRELIVSLLFYIDSVGDQSFTVDGLSRATICGGGAEGGGHRSFLTIDGRSA